MAHSVCPECGELNYYEDSHKRTSGTMMTAVTINRSVVCMASLDVDAVSFAPIHKIRCKDRCAQPLIGKEVVAVNLRTWVS